MKVVVDLDRALAEGKITAEEHRRIGALASGQGSDLALNILVAFGVTGVAAGSLALAPSTAMAAFTGCLLCAISFVLMVLKLERWRMLSDTLLVVGSMFLAAAAVMFDAGSMRSALAAATLFTAGAILARNGFLAGLAVLALSAALGARTGYVHAMYMIGVEQPFTTVVVFMGLATTLVLLSKQVPHDLSRLAVIAARVSALLVNLGFWIGSLWGDRHHSILISRDAFALLWAVAILSAALWAWRENRRWPLITAAVFAGVHFYTQWFERLGAHPGAVVAAGIVTIGIALGIRSLLTRMPVRTA